MKNTWRKAHFIEYYYVGIGGYCGMSQPIEQQDNNFIGIRVMDDPDQFSANFLYAEFQNGTDGNIDFQSIAHHELFDLTTDPWQLNNIYDTANASVKEGLHKQVQQW